MRGVSSICDQTGMYVCMYAQCIVSYDKSHDQNSLLDCTSSLIIGERCVEDYDIISQVGEGTYGQVYKAKRKANGMCRSVVNYTLVKCHLRNCLNIVASMCYLLS